MKYLLDSMMDSGLESDLQEGKASANANRRKGKLKYTLHYRRDKKAFIEDLKPVYNTVREGRL
ncbi:hypothetical protein [Sphingobacterium sp. WOUb80]|uniref:hypothetical protein n=1 Tax=Sphingobacterium sp. WOUb80 TaxID=3234028 RepID=UPI003CF6F0A2